MWSVQPKMKSLDWRRCHTAKQNNWIMSFKKRRHINGGPRIVTFTGAGKSPSSFRKLTKLFSRFPTICFAMVFFFFFPHDHLLRAWWAYRVSVTHAWWFLTVRCVHVRVSSLFPHHFESLCFTKIIQSNFRLSSLVVAVGTDGLSPPLSLPPHVLSPAHWWQNHTQECFQICIRKQRLCLNHVGLSSIFLCIRVRYTTASLLFNGLSSLYITLKAQPSLKAQQVILLPHPYTYSIQDVAAPVCTNGS